MLVLVAVGSLTIGAASIPLGELMLAISTDDVEHTILFDIRLPRTLLAILVGAGVGTSGAAIQGLFRNPLADPALIGVSGGAALFAAGFLVFGARLGVSVTGVAGSAFFGGLLTTWLVLAVGRRGGTISSMLLAGIAINAVALSGVGIFSYISTDLELRSVAFWVLGSLNGADWQAVGIASLIPVAILLFMTRSQSLNAITLGDREAGHLGISVSRLRLEIIILTAVTVGISVALCGVIAFIGLIVPHLIRMTAGPNHFVVIPGSAILGGLLLLLADTLSRTMLSPAELPVGIVTALLGGPFFIYLIVRQRGSLGL